MARYNFPDVKQIRQQARREWERDMRARQTIQERIGATVPYWLVIIALGLFLLSASHTIEVFNGLAQGVGFAAPLVVEFSLLYAAFMRRRHGESVSASTTALERISFILALGVNSVGAFTTVLDTSGLSKLSVSQFVYQFGSVPAASQLEFLFVPLAALLIPIGTVAAGEGIAKLMLDGKQSRDLSESKWTDDQLEYFAKLLYEAALNNKIPPTPASMWVNRVVNGERQLLAPPTPKALPAPKSDNSVSPVSETERNSPAQPIPPAVQAGMAWLIENRAVVLETNGNRRKLSEISGIPLATIQRAFSELPVDAFKENN